MPWRSAQAPNSASAPGRAAAEQDEVGLVHDRVSAVRSCDARTPGVALVSFARRLCSPRAFLPCAPAAELSSAARLLRLRPSTARPSSAPLSSFRTARDPAFRAAARSMIASSISPASPPFAGRFEIQTSGLSAARMSSKSPSLLTLCGANSVMSTSPAQSSRCLISSQLARRRLRPASPSRPCARAPTSLSACSRRA